ncbi:hypothetical protein NE237_016650 [Protea cynaroides]|uniref:Uncharacterized protein n=1 Tax=Protea cynaroides TaxID=273540 RepID=A0A9Q0K6D5_9MAGN|nr:hypothetical protein NE237_016650 [Protea cynaroides]
MDSNRDILHYQDNVSTDPLPPSINQVPSIPNPLPPLPSNYHENFLALISNSSSPKSVVDPLPYSGAAPSAGTSSGGNSTWKNSPLPKPRKLKTNLHCAPISLEGSIKMDGNRERYLAVGLTTLSDPQVICPNPSVFAPVVTPSLQPMNPAFPSYSSQALPSATSLVRLHNPFLALDGLYTGLEDMSSTFLATASCNLNHQQPSAANPHPSVPLCPDIDGSDLHSDLAVQNPKPPTLSISAPSCVS